MNVTRCEASHGGTGGESLPRLSAMFTADKGLSAKSSRRVNTSPTPRPRADPRLRAGKRAACSRRGARRSLTPQARSCLQMGLTVRRGLSMRNQRQEVRLTDQGLTTSDRLFISKRRRSEVPRDAHPQVLVDHLGRRRGRAPEEVRQTSNIYLQSGRRPLLYQMRSSRGRRKTASSVIVQAFR
jgi:hypothetical protein